MAVLAGSAHSTAASLAAAASSFREMAAAAYSGIPPAGFRRDVAALFAGEREVRFFMDGTRNLGHQASTLALLRRFVEVTGFSGRIVVLFADYARPNLGTTREKIALLVPELTPETVETTSVAVGQATVAFIHFDRRRQVCADSVSFGISGGADDMTANYARECNVRWFLRLQPFLWDDDPELKEDAYYESSRLEGLDGSFMYLCDEFPPLASLPFRDVDPSCQRDLHPEKQSSGEVVWPIYGLHHYPETAGMIALRAAMAAWEVAARGGRPVELRCYRPFEEARWLHLPMALAKDVREGDPACPHLDEALRASAAVDAGQLVAAAAAMHRALRTVAPLDGAIGAAPFGLTSSPLVDGVTFRSTMLSSSLPPIVEGQVAANMLAANGRPYLHLLRPGHTVSRGYWKGDGDPVVERAAERMERLSRILSAPALDEGSPSPPRTTEVILLETAEIVDFCIECQEGSGELPGYFADVEAWLSTGWRDKLQIGLLSFLSIAPR